MAASDKAKEQSVHHRVLPDEHFADFCFKGGETFLKLNLVCHAWLLIARWSRFVYALTACRAPASKAVIGPSHWRLSRDKTQEWMKLDQKDKVAGSWKMPTTARVGGPYYDANVNTYRVVVFEGSRRKSVSSRPAKRRCSSRRRRSSANSRTTTSSVASPSTSSWPGGRSGKAQERSLNTTGLQKTVISCPGAAAERFYAGTGAGALRGGDRGGSHALAG